MKVRTAIFAASVASLGFIHSQSHGADEMPTTNFQPVQLFGATMCGRYLVEWQHPQTLSVRVAAMPHLPKEAANGNLAHRLPLSTTDQQTLTASLADLPAADLPAGTSYELRMPGTSIELRRWDAADEPVALARSREAFERVGHVRYYAAKACLFAAAISAEAGEFAAAVRLLRAGIDDLGRRHADHRVLDDTGMTLVQAGRAEKQGEFRQAAALYRKVLDTRLKIYANQYLTDVTR